jgi:exosortase
MARLLSDTSPPLQIRRVVAIAAIIAAIVWLYADTMSSLVRQWASDDNYSHGVLVVPFAAYFAWQRRSAFRRTPVRPSATGLVVVLCGLALFAAGQLAAELFLERVSLIVLLTGALWFLAGWEHVALAAFPLAFLLFMVPLPAVVFNQITFPLQTVAARAGQALIAIAGVPVLRDGHVLQIPGRTLEVAEACSGIRSLVSLFMMAAVLGYFADDGRGGTRMRVVRRLVLLAAAVPIAILANAARVAGTGLACYWISAEAADGYFHTFSGWLVFAVAFAGLLIVQRTMTWGRRLLLRPASSSGVLA